MLSRFFVYLLLINLLPHLAMLFEETEIVQNLFYKTKYLVKVKPYIDFAMPPLAYSRKMKKDDQGMVKKIGRIFPFIYCLFLLREY